jgi:serine/threonine-protein kinase RsbW
MQIRLSLSLPRDRVSVPVTRRLCSEALITLGADPDCTSDIEVALTEACTNVLEHVGADEEYEVTVSVDGDQCVIEVIDTGRGFDADALGLSDAEVGAEGGRGIQLIRALTDRASFTRRGDSGTVVHLEKTIAWSADGLAAAASTG